MEEQNLQEEKKRLANIDAEMLNLLNCNIIFPNEPPKHNKRASKYNDNQQIIQLLTKNIEELNTSLECPVCFEIAKVPIFQCGDGHLICSTCKPKINKCPECRKLYSRNLIRNRYAERDSEKLANLIQQVIDLAEGETDAQEDNSSVGGEGSNSNDDGAQNMPMDGGEKMEICGNPNVENAGTENMKMSGHQDGYQKLFIANLPHSVTDIDLKELLTNYGRVENIKLVTKGRGKKKRTTAIAIFGNVESVDKALRDQPIFLYGNHQVSVRRP